VTFSNNVKKKSVGETDRQLDPLTEKLCSSRMKKFKEVLEIGVVGISRMKIKISVLSFK
jgi:hypothetical protein